MSPCKWFELCSVNHGLAMCAEDMTMTARAFTQRTQNAGSGKMRRPARRCSSAPTGPLALILFLSMEVGHRSNAGWPRASYCSMLQVLTPASQENSKQQVAPKPSKRPKHYPMPPPAAPCLHRPEWQRSWSWIVGLGARAEGTGKYCGTSCTGAVQL